MTAASEGTGGTVTVLPRAHARDCAVDPAEGEAREVPSEVPSELPSPRRRVAERARQAADIGVMLTAMVNKPGTLLHAQPPTFWQAWDRHKECAGHFEMPVARGARRVWGAAHVAVVLPVIYLFIWVTESPLRTVITAALLTAIWYFA